jgi:hypothetical protein
MQCALPSCSKAAKQKCAACRSLGYCSRKHQRSDWKAHKKECQRIVQAEAAASGEGGAGGGAPEAAPEGKDAGGGNEGEVAEQPTPVARHVTLRAMMKDDAFDINTTLCGPRGLRALWFALGVRDVPIDEDAVKMVLDEPGLNIHAADLRGRKNMLWVQCSWGRTRNVELLLADGRNDPNQCCADTGSSPLWVAANNGRDLCVALLLADPRVDPNIVSSNGTTPLSTAANQGWDGCVALFLADGRMDPNQCSTDTGSSPLWVAANNGRDLCVKLLLADPRVDPNLADLNDYTTK